MSRQLLRCAIVTLTLAGLGACADDSTQRVSREKYSTYPENVKKAIDKGAILKGMTQEQVILAVGQTSCIDARIVQGTHLDSWGYHADQYTGKLSAPGRCPGDHPVIFEDGYVIEGQSE